MRKIVLLICLTAGALQTTAQTKPVAMKFDEFTDKTTTRHYYPYSELTFGDRLKRYKKELQTNISAKPYIIFYKARITDEANQYDTDHWFASPRQELRTLRRFEGEDKVPQVFGGYREENTLELWIVPKGAGAPKPSPSVDGSESIVCPEIRIYPDGFYFDKSRPVTFKADMGSMENISYQWSVSAGEVVSEKDRSEVTLDMSNAASDNVTVIVKVKGLPLPCKTSAYTTIKVGPHPYLFDRTESFNYSELSARTDNLMLTLNNDPTLRAYIICYSARTGPSAGINYGLTGIRRSILFRKYPTERIILINAGSRDLARVEMWLLPPGAEPPQPAPTVDQRFVKRSKRRPGSDVYY